MTGSWIKYLFLAAGMAILAVSLVQIPLLGSSVFLSPDETATAVSARAFGLTGAMRIEESILKDAPWMHPRSFVTQGSAMVPVGFLGLPFVLGIVWRLLGEWGLVFFAPLLALSVVYPLWRFMRPSGLPAQIAASVAWLTFPTVILYANRGLFPNLPAVCLAVWAAYLVWEHRSHVRSVVAGLCAGFALAIRPVEALWILPWLAVAWRFRLGRKQHQERISLAIAVASCLLVLFAGCLVAWKTYGSPFAVGYFLRDPIREANFQYPISNIQSPSFVWPFGFHPRNVWFNVKTYLFGYLGSWLAVALLAGFVHFKRRPAWPIIAVCVWTAIVGSLLYGQAIYQDHVGVNVASVGNSFLRYLLPAAPLFALAVGALVGWMFGRFSDRQAALLSILLVASLASVGSWTAMKRDDESVIPSAAELGRYALIRSATVETLGPNAIILSERSDKIFFPRYRVSGLLPTIDQMRWIVERSPIAVALFSTTLDDDGLTRWNRDGFILRPVFQSQNQTLYLMGLVHATSAP